jgi:DNA-binding PadR family transcriptional regulator
MGARSNLGEFEQLVLLAVLQLDDGAYGPAICAALEKALGRSVSRGALYSSLARLEQKGFLAWTVEAASSARGGNRNRHFTVTQPGLETLREARAALMKLSEGLESKLEKVNR